MSRTTTFIRNRPGTGWRIPPLKTNSLQALLKTLTECKAACVIGTAVTTSNFGLGRIIRNSQGDFEKIVEEKDATENEKKIQEINTGCYAFDGAG